jgi:adenosylhomocysteine nucleosidase
MYGILCATPEELAAVRARIVPDGAPRRFGPTEVWTGEHEGQAVALAICGIGKVNAAAAATLLLSVFDAELLIFSGVAGGLNPELPVGSVLLADRLGIHDYGLVAGRQFTPTLSGVIPIGAPRLSALTPVADEVSARLVRLAVDVQGKVEGSVRLGGVITGDYFLNCAQTRDELHAAFGADAVDMESGAVGQIAAEWDVPLYVIRTLSDLAGEESHLTYGEMAQMAAHNSALCVMDLLAILAADA